MNQITNAMRIVAGTIRRMDYSAFTARHYASVLSMALKRTSRRRRRGWTSQRS